MQNYLVIMAGGIGSRFWPFSRQNKPKQFLDFFGTGRTLIQMTADRYRGIVPEENILVVSNVQYKDVIKEQLPYLADSQILCEPARRNTAPCIYYAIAHILGELKNKNEKLKIEAEEALSTLNYQLSTDINIIVAASDHLILNELEFRRVITEGVQYVSEHDEILTLGMKPTRPETGYGYIQVENLGTPELRHSLTSEIKKVKTFTEKPNRELAEKFVQSGEFLWNSGMFLFSLKTIVKAYNQYLPEVVEKFAPIQDKMGTEAENAAIQKIFPACPNISVDYGIMEKADNVSVMAADFGWSDLGTWGSLYSLSDKDEAGNVSLHSTTRFHNAERNIVTLESGKRAVIQGLNDYIVAEKDRVLLICPLSEEQQIRDFVNEAEEEYK